MRTYQIPPDMKEKEKVVGGILNVNQLFWVLGGLGVGGCVFGLTFTLTGAGSFSIILGVIFCLSGLPFALKKVKGLTLYEYLYRKRKFKKKIKHLPNIRKEVKYQ